MHNVSVYQQLKQPLSIAWIALVTRYIHCKLAPTAKI